MLKLHAPSRPFASCRHARELLFRVLALGTDVALGAHGKDWREGHERVLGRVNTAGGVEILEQEDFERGPRDLDPEPMRRANKGRAVDVDRIEDIVLQGG